MSFTNFRRDSFWYAMAALMVLLALLGDPATGLLNYDRELITKGQYWRLFSAHTVHLGFTHLLLNATALILVGLLVGSSYQVRTWWAIFGTLSVGISICLWLLNPELLRYVGASGVIHGLVACGAMGSFHRHRVEASVLLLGLIAKIAIEQWSGPTATTEALIGGRVITDAHLYGAIGGALIGGLLFATDRDTSRH